MDPLLILFGLGVGILVGTTGMGGGSLMTPLLILVFGIKPVVAIGTDLAYAAVTKTVGGWRHFRQGTVDVPLALWLGVGSIPGALGGTLLLDRLQAAYGDSIDNGVIIAVAVALLFTGVAVFWRALFMPTVVERERDTIEPLERRHKVAAVALGVTIGFVLGATSAGSGALIAVGLILIFRLRPLRVVGTDVFHAAIVLWVAALAHLASGNVDLHLVGNILIGSVPGVWIGARLATTLPPDGLRTALGVVLLASALGLLTKVGVGIPAPVLVGAPLALGVVAYFVAPRALPPPARGHGQRMSGYELTHLRTLESEAIHLIREVAAERERPVLLFSGGKDSIVLLHLAQKAFRPAGVPFPVMHVDTGHNFPEVIAFRDRRVEELGVELVVASVQDSIDRGRVVEETGPRASRNRLQTTTLLDAIAEHGFDAAFGGARRDEERARAKERMLSFRDEHGQWDPKAQRPELWSLYNGRIHRGEHVRVFPLSNWTELDVWRYIAVEALEVPSIYFAHDRQVFARDGMLYALSPYVELIDGEEPFATSVRYRTVGDMSCTGAVRSTAATLETVVAEIAATRITERGETRADDRVSEAAMEDRKREGYF